MYQTENFNDNSGIHFLNIHGKLSDLYFKYVMVNWFVIAVLFLLFSVRYGHVIFRGPSGRWTAPSCVGRWLFYGVCFWGNSPLTRCFPFLFVERAWLQDMDCSLCFKSAVANGWLFYMWLRSLQWPVLRNIDDTLYKAVADINYRGESSILPYVLSCTSQCYQWVMMTTNIHSFV